MTKYYTGPITDIQPKSARHTGYMEATACIEGKWWRSYTVTLHDTIIMEIIPEHHFIRLSFGGHFTPTTTSHMNKMLEKLYFECLWVPMTRVGYNTSKSGRITVHISMPHIRAKDNVNRKRESWGGYGRIVHVENSYGHPDSVIYHYQDDETEKMGQQ